VKGGKWWGKEIGGQMQCKNCVYMFVDAKMIPFEVILGIGGRIKENVGKGKFKCDIFDTL
jgi:hypothetical protein